MNLVRWIWRAWPLLVVCGVSAVHFAVLGALPAHSVQINKIAGTLLQVIGGLVVLHSVNESLGLFKGQSLWALVVAWLRQFPFRRKVHHVLMAGIGHAGAFGGTAKISVERAATTIDERVDRLERQVVDLRRELNRSTAAVHQRIDDVRTELSTTLSTHKIALDQLASNLEKATVGGFKQQAFGVLLALYGAGTSVFA